MGDSPTRARVRNPVAWIVGRKETESREPIDKTIEGWRASHRAVMIERTCSLETESQGPSLSSWGEGSMDGRRLTEAAGPLWRGHSDSTMARMRQATGEALLAPSRNRRSREPYNRQNREVGDRREGGGGVRSSGEAEQCLWSEGTLLFVTAPTIWEARAK